MEQDSDWDRACLIAYFSGNAKDAKGPDELNVTLRRTDRERIEDDQWLAEQVEPGTDDTEESWIAEATRNAPARPAAVPDGRNPVDGQQKLD
jgi:hypothetical protein